MVQIHSLQSSFKGVPARNVWVAEEWREDGGKVHSVAMFYGSTTLAFFHSMSNLIKPFGWPYNSLGHDGYPSVLLKSSTPTGTLAAGFTHQLVSILTLTLQ